MTRGKSKKQPSGMTATVMCVRCCRIYVYRGSPEARCPKCGFNKWVDPRILCRELAAGGETTITAARGFSALLWKAADFVETDDINEDVAADEGIA